MVAKWSRSILPEIPRLTQVRVAAASRAGDAMRWRMDLIMTIKTRKEKTLYVSVWYFTMTFFWTIGFYPIGNVMWHPVTGSLNGLLDSLLLSAPVAWFCWASGLVGHLAQR